MKKKTVIALGGTCLLVGTAFLLKSPPLTPLVRKIEASVQKLAALKAESPKAQNSTFPIENKADDGKSKLDDPEELEKSFLALNEALESESGLHDKSGQGEAIRGAAQHLVSALAWRENPSRKLLLIQFETLFWNQIRVAGSRAGALAVINKDESKRKLFIAFRDSAGEEVERLKNENPESALVKILAEI